MIRVPISTLPLFFVRVKGTNGFERELVGTVSPGASYTVIPKIVALHLGYADALRHLPEEEQRYESAMVSTMTGIIQAPVIELQEVLVGNAAARGVRALAVDSPEPAGVDVILGQTFLCKFKLTVDYRTSHPYFQLE